MKSLELLMQEHRLIERGLALLKNIADRLERGESVSIEKVISLLDFFRVFADKCHHAKEEKALFPKLETRGIPREGGPIGVMLNEHEKGRTLQEQMRQALSDFLEAKARQNFVSSAREYITLLSQHIWKEDNVLFQMAKQILNKSDDMELEKSFESYEQEQIGGDSHEQYHKLICELEAYFLLHHNN
jgi:hemerythrin-like domain-containing protein